MDHADHVNLLRDGVTNAGGVWADLGAGSGAFTLALAELLGNTAEVYAIDSNGHALEANAKAMRMQFPGARVHYQSADFTQRLQLPKLDGIVMANSLHFQRSQSELTRELKTYLRDGGRVLVVEYNIDRGNSAVPYPVPYWRWEEIAREAEFEHTRLLSRRPSRFLREIYSAASW